MILIFLINNCLAQHDLDSLKRVIGNQKLHDTARLASVGILLDYLYENEEVVYYNELMGKISKSNLSTQNSSALLKEKYTLYLATYYNNKSFQFEDKGDSNSLNYLNKSLELYRSINANGSYYTSLISKGIILSKRKRYKEAVDCYFEALKYFEKNTAENLDGISYVYSNLGVLYGDQEQWKEAIKYLKKSIVYINKKQNKFIIEDDLQLCINYYNIGSYYIKLNDFEQARINLETALTISEKHQQNSYTAFVLGKLGIVDLHFGKLDEAEKKLIKANELAESNVSKAFSLAYLGEVYFEKKEFKRAESTLENALELSKILKKDDLKEKIYKLLYKINKNKGDYRKALTMIELYNSIHDSTKIVETRNILKQQQLKYDFEKKELNYKLKTEKANASKNNLLIVLSSSLLLLLIGSFFLYRNYKQKQKLNKFEKNELKQKLLLTQMNPHFIFNSIDNIQSLIHHKQEKEAISYLTKFSKLTRQILENSNENYISLEEELSMIDNYLTIQRLLYNNKFEFKINVNEKITTEYVLVPPMLTQPFIENAIKHGLKNVSALGQIVIDFKMNEDKLLFSIEDNGVGFLDADKESTKKSMAIKITKERLSSISKKSDFDLKKENLFDDDEKIIGARVSFEIPYIYEN